MKRRPGFDSMFVGVALSAVAFLVTWVMTDAIQDELDARAEAVFASVAVADHVRASDGCAFRYDPPETWSCTEDRAGLCTQPVDCVDLADQALGSRVEIAKLGDGRLVPSDTLDPEDALRSRLWWFRIGWLVALAGAAFAVTRAMKVRTWHREQQGSSNS